ncbi:acyltransferase [SAR92 clade bacterium H455]|uniref:Acyltransferase n=1 Tax=SAR92 clade bacterium H455 TaxID=2974818 RepID=A0ABY5TUG4_9GAMM|nr:acyltransferase [SAR92 clade bacterium H455]
MKYRAEIDGLRALAVVPVILFHAGFELFSGGFVGVDVFFVISGYLITTILIEDIENKQFSIVNFYERRARRILPALFFVMLVCIPFAWMWMLPNQMKDFSQSLVAVSLFASNILFWRESGYFDAAAEEKPLLHTWSLAVEEQYYVLFPIFLILAWRFGKNRVFWMIVVMAAVSLLLSEWGWRNKATANFYLAPTRAWELFSGSIAAFIVQKQGVQRNNLLALVGLAAIIFSIFFYDETTPFPSVYALVPVIGVVMLVLYAEKATFAAKLLSMRGIVGIGLISYSAYLWHQPLFAFARIESVSEPSLLLMAILAVSSLFLAYLSWRYIETPFRNNRGVGSAKILVYSSFGLLLFASFGFVGNKQEGFALQRYDRDYLIKTDINFLRSKRYPKLGNLNLSPTWALLGDSHADSLQEAFSKMLTQHNKSALVLTEAGCPPSLNLWRHDMDYKMRCHDNYLGAIDKIKDASIQHVLISARYALYINSTRFDNTIGGIEKGRSKEVIYDLIDYKDTLRAADERAHAIENELVSYVVKLVDEGINVYILESIPEFGWNVSEQLSASLPTNIPRSAFDERVESLQSLYRRFSNIHNVTLLSTDGFFCNEIECISTVDGIPLFYDSNHLSNFGADSLLDYFESNLMKNINE